MKNNIRKTALLGLFVAAAMILSYIESFIPFPVPGVKMGLPNIIIVFVLYRFGFPSAAAVSFVRVVLVSLLLGNMMSLWYSVAGAVLSLLIMTLLRKAEAFSSVGVSVAGGVSHNAGQIAVAILVTGVKQIGYYMPVLAVSGIVSGIIVGIAGGMVLKRFEKIKL